MKDKNIFDSLLGRLGTNPADQHNDNATKAPSLLFCIAMDGVGMLSYVFPGLGEVLDVVWAPISALIFMKTFGGVAGKVGAIINFIEEAAPYTDIIPTFTIAYFYQKYHASKKTS